jgi:GT2 family glycosyltransferase
VDSLKPAVVVPTHAGGPRLAALLDSLAAQTVETEVVVVDNAAPVGTAALVAAHAPAARLVSLEENAGFGRAINHGVAATTSNVLVLVNDDAICEPYFVERLIVALAPSEGVVMAAGVLLAADDSMIDTAGIMFDETLLAFDYLHGEPLSILDVDVAEPLGPSGGAAAYDREAFEAVGGFDEAFFAYLEDVDLAARLLARGGHCRLAPDARAVHHHSATLGSASARKNELMGWSRGYMIGKYRIHRHPRLLARMLLAELAIAGGQIVVDGTVSGIRSRVQGFRAGMQRNAEPWPALPSAALQISVREALARRMRRRAARTSR